jgi:copper chaperone CopZ
MKEDLKLSIDGMHCDGCVRRVTTALQAIPSVEVDTVEVGSAHLKFSPKQAQSAEIVAAVERIGFQAHVQQ